ncbi:MAG TPA: glycosyl hydrolase 108 family protein [Candidatus Sulfotelmatobacter sp.]|nr:glycosyl hydrolase 108 family protein [Candidatus Sulfotelmatobacter sp.]
MAGAAGQGVADADFAAAVELVLGNEGGLVDDPRDPGGITHWGISLRAYPQLGRAGILALTREQAKTLYRADWWDRHHFGALPWPVSAKVFDLAVNIGAAAAVRLLQGACAACGQAVALDGLIGPATIAAARGCDPDALRRTLTAAAAAHYRSLVRENPELARFLAGWLNRTDRWSA